MPPRGKMFRDGTYAEDSVLEGPGSYRCPFGGGGSTGADTPSTDGIPDHPPCRAKKGTEGSRIRQRRGADHRLVFAIAQFLMPPSPLLM